MTAPSLPTLAFAVLLAASAASLGALHGTDAGLDVLMRRQHIRPASTTQWMAVQPLPGMYTFSNRVWASRELVPCAEWEATATSLGHANHYPTRVATFENRDGWGFAGTPRYLYVESQVRGRTLHSAFHLDRTTDGLHMARLGDELRCRS